MRHFLFTFIITVIVAVSSISSAAEVVQVEIHENIPTKNPWAFKTGPSSDRFTAPAMALRDVPHKYNRQGLRADRSAPFLVRARVTLDLPAGKVRLLLRARSAARLLLNGKVLTETKWLSSNASGHEKVPDLLKTAAGQLLPLSPGQQQRIVTIDIPETVDLKSSEPNLLIVEALVGGKGLRTELGELIVAVAADQGPFYLVGAAKSVPLTFQGWSDYEKRHDVWLHKLNKTRRRAAGAQYASAWNKRHTLARKIWMKRSVPIPSVKKSAGANPIDAFIGKRLESANVRPAPLIDDLTFLRRVTLDTVGVIPTREEIVAYLRDEPGSRRNKAIDRLLADPRWADHWVAYWQDVLAENPGILKPKLNNTGPFRFWIYESFLDNKPFDRFAHELVMMQGSRYGGGPAGFEMATGNDAPMAAKAHVIAQAFMGMKMKCARCHDAPNHSFKQRDTFELAAMLSNKPIKLPKSSTVQLTPGARRPSITISLKAGELLQPRWPFDRIASGEVPFELIGKKSSHRERLAGIITSPRNERFAQVIANRLWARYMGLGIVDPVDDWEYAEPSHPQLLKFLGRELAIHDYDLKHLARVIFTSRAYQRKITTDVGEEADQAKELFASPTRRRMSAEQILDSLFQVAGKSFDAEMLTLDPEGRRPASSFLNLGHPRRAWQLVALSNERDRPALSLPVNQSLLDVMVPFGWRESRSDAITSRDVESTVLQPLIVANGVVGNRITRLSDDGAVTEMTLERISLDEMIDKIYLRVFTRRPEPDERLLFRRLLSAGFEDRVIVGAKKSARRRDLRTAVSWSNHLDANATRIKLELERRIIEGDPPTLRISGEWRKRMEDMLWSLVNSPEFVFVP